jgi:hypothetical protein
MTARRACSYTSPKLKAGIVPGKGRGVYCVEPIRAGEVVALIGGVGLPLAVAMAMPMEQRCQCLQVEDDLVLWIGDHEETAADWINHSCDPNVGISGQITLVAMRAIAAGEEVCFDYAMSDGSPIDEFACACGSATCRASVTGEDWRLPDLQARYRGYFSAYLTRRMAREHPAALSPAPDPGRARRLWRRSA